MLTSVNLVRGVVRMKARLGLRVIPTLFVALLLPLELSHCALMPLGSFAAAIEPGHDRDRDCCAESAPAHELPSPTEPCCCGNIQISDATIVASISVDAPNSTPRPFAVVAMTVPAVNVSSVFVRLEPDARSGSPPDPSTAPQSPRSPPYSA